MFKRHHKERRKLWITFKQGQVIKQNAKHRTSLSSVQPSLSEDRKSITINLQRRCCPSNFTSRDRRERINQIGSPEANRKCGGAAEIHDSGDARTAVTISQIRQAVLHKLCVAEK